LDVAAFRQGSGGKGVATSGFLSTATNKVDAKRRVSLPAAFRDLLADEAVRAVYCFPSLDHSAIEGVSPSRMDQMVDLVDELGPYSEEGQALANGVLARAHKLDVDDDGRVLLPESLMAHAGVSDRATFVGLGRRFEIWAPEQHASQAINKPLAREALTKLKLVRKGGAV
jgi:MraZ protein